MEKLAEKLAYGASVEKVFVGIDVHKKSYAVCVMVVGEGLKKWSMPSEPRLLAEKLRRDFPEREVWSVYEAGFSGFELHRVLERAGIKSQVVHAASVAVRSNDKVKTDKRDAAKLAQQLAVGMLNGVRVPSEEEELRRVVTRTRDQLVRSRTRVKNQVRRRLVHFGYFCHYQGGLKIKDVEALLTEFSQDNELTFCIKSLLRTWKQLHAEILIMNRAIREQFLGCRAAQIYESFPGVGVITAQILANELGDMSQFANEQSLFSFLGFTPSESSSGERVKKGRISRQGSGQLRRVLVESAWVAIRYDEELRAYYKKISARSGCAKKAIVAVARKLAGRMRAALRKNEEYQRVEKKEASA